MRRAFAVCPSVATKDCAYTRHNFSVLTPIVLLQLRHDLLVANIVFAHADVYCPTMRHELIASNWLPISGKLAFQKDTSWPGWPWL